MRRYAPACLVARLAPQPQLNWTAVMLQVLQVLLLLVMLSDSASVHIAAAHSCAPRRGSRRTEGNKKGASACAWIDLMRLRIDALIQESDHSGPRASETAARITDHAAARSGKTTTAGLYNLSSGIGECCNHLGPGIEPPRLLHESNII